MTLTVDNVAYRGALDFLYHSPYVDERIDTRSVKRISSGVYETCSVVETGHFVGPFTVFWPQILVNRYLKEDRGWTQEKIDRWLWED